MTFRCLPLKTVCDQLRLRRHAVDSGEVHRMWPGAAVDVLSLVWFRVVGDNTWRPFLRWLHGPSPDEEFHSSSGECPLCSFREDLTFTQI